MGTKKNNSGLFKKGNPGKPKGAQAHLTKTVKETVLAVFNDLQGDRKVNLKAFARKYPRDFYQIAAKLIPTEINAKVNKISLEIVRANDSAATDETASGAAESAKRIQAL